MAPAAPDAFQIPDPRAEDRELQRRLAAAYRRRPDAQTADLYGVPIVTPEIRLLEAQIAYNRSLAPAAPASQGALSGALGVVGAVFFPALGAVCWLVAVLMALCSVALILAIPVALVAHLLGLG